MLALTEGDAMMGSKSRDFEPLCNRSIEDLMPADNPYCQVEVRLAGRGAP